MARSDLHSGRVCRYCRDDSHACSTVACRGVLAWALQTTRAAHTSLDRWNLGFGGGPSRCRTLDHQSARRDRCSIVCFADPVLGLGCDCYVGRIRRRFYRHDAQQVKSSATYLAARAYHAHLYRYRRNDNPCDVDRRYNGDSFQVCSLLASCRGGGKSVERPKSLETLEVAMTAQSLGGIPLAQSL